MQRHLKYVVGSIHEYIQVVRAPFTDYIMAESELNLALESTKLHCKCLLNEFRLHAVHFSESAAYAVWARLVRQLPAACLMTAY